MSTFEHKHGHLSVRELQLLACIGVQDVQSDGVAGHRVRNDSTHAARSTNALCSHTSRADRENNKANISAGEGGKSTQRRITLAYREWGSDDEGKCRGRRGRRREKVERKWHDRRTSTVPRLLEYTTAIPARATDPMLPLRTDTLPNKASGPPLLPLSLPASPLRRAEAPEAPHSVTRSLKQLTSCTT